MTTEQTTIERIKEGVYSLQNIPLEHLKQMAREQPNGRLKDMMGCEIMYRSNYNA